jgi:hypothetical protein
MPADNALTPEDWRRVLKAARRDVILFSDPNPRLALGDALRAAEEEINKILVERDRNER